jgi:YesN/AraC family two-component response regulator
MLENSYISDEIYEKLLVRKTLGRENHVALPPERRENVLHLISALYSEYERLGASPDPLFEIFAARVIDGILVELIRESCAVSGSEVNEPPSAIGQAVVYIHAHSHERITLRSVAASVHLSAGYFSELFKKTTGQNFKNYLVDLRIKNACRMLTKSNGTVTDICYATGFESYANFMRTFKARC